MDREKLRELLESVSDSYCDFVNTLLRSLRTDEDRQRIGDYITMHENVDTSSVLDYYSDEIRNIPKYEN